MKLLLTSLFLAGVSVGATVSNGQVSASSTQQVRVVEPSEPLQLDESLMRAGQRGMTGRTREMRPGISHEASLAVEAAQAEQRADEPRSAAESTNKTVEVSGAATTRDIGSVASPTPIRSAVEVKGDAQEAGASPAATLTPAQRAAQEAARKRKDVPVRSAE